MVERQKVNSELIQEVKKIYDWLDSQIENNIPEKCDACGQCCDFITYDHRLYVTVLEIIFMVISLNVDNLKPMQTGVCPYNEKGKCTVHQYRFAGCRIFNCKADADVQSQLSEESLKKFKELCENYNILYRYMELSNALNQ
ncbi:MAG: hypothetical protein JXA96_06500 [Sedimentisphaerales bacterium]|nr:hypothetical protein [Sedimentisphaerales bacterium]